MSKSIATDFMHTNSEYEKLKNGGTDRGQTPRGTPKSQGPGQRGYDKAFYADWTMPDLRRQAEQLDIDIAESVDRDKLIAILEQRDASMARRGSAAT